jgi:hypothetical protein
MTRPSRLPALAAAAAAAAFVIAGEAAAGSQAAPVSAAAPAPGTARVWFYRTFFPGDTIDMPAIAMNGQTVGYARAGYSFYRDVPAGAYHVTVETVGRDFSQSKDLTLAPGTQILVAIQSDPTMIENLKGSREPTHYVWIEPAATAQLHLAQTMPSTGY